MLVTCGLRYGGAERVVQALAEDLTDRGHAAMVVATTRGGPIGTALRHRGIPVQVLGLRSAVDLRVPGQLRRVIERFGPDVVHSHLAVADIAVTAARAPGRVCTVHNPGVELSRFKRGLWRAVLPWFRIVTAVSETVRRALPVDARVVHPSTISGDSPVLSRSEARRRLSLSEDAPVVLFVGRLSRVKGLDVLAAAAETLEPHYRIVVVGEGPEHRALEGTRLELVGARDDAADLMAAADVVVMPSRSEGFPQVPLQAMAAGVPVVGTAVGGTPEIVEHERTGLLVPPEDPEALGAAIRRTLSAPDERRRWGEAGRRRLAEANLTRSGMVDATVSLYREVAGQ